MASERVKEIKNAFSAYPGLLDNFQGQDLAQLFALQIAKKQSFKDGFNAGIEEGVETIGNLLIADLRKQFDNYMAINTRIVDYVKEIIDKKEKFEDCQFIKARADLSFFSTKEIKIMFIVDTTIKNELKLSSLLNDISMNVFDEENIFPELLILNKKNKEIDEVAIEASYPSFRVYSKQNA